MVKAKWALVVLLVAALAAVGVGCNKVTGGGWFIDEDTDHKITLGFTAQPTGDESAKGQFQLVDHFYKPPLRIHGTFIATSDEIDPNESAFAGTCSINGQGEYDFGVIWEDYGEPGVSAGDYLEIGVDSSPEIHYSGYLSGGNIQVH